MKSKTINTFFAGIFVITLFIPLFSTDLRDGVVSERENRILADRPPLSSISHPRTFIVNFNQWFNDHVGFREDLISVYRKLNRFQKSGPQYKEGDLTYIVGREGHHFFTGYNHELIARFQGKIIFFSDEQLQVFSQKLTAIKNYLDEKDIPFIVMFCADKEAIYPEYYSTAIKRGPEPIQLDIITDYLQNNTPVDVFNIRQTLVSKKGKYLLYPKKPPGDLAHYNEIGAFFAYSELMKHINIYFPEIVPYTLEDINISCDENGVATMSLKNSSYIKLDSNFFDTVNVSRPFSVENEVFENIGANSLTVLFLRDSYMGANGSFVSKYIAQHFNRTVLIHMSNTANFKQYIDAFVPDIVVVELVDRGLVQFFDCLNQLEL
jgi:hypothetical protein